jgi:hypothetical protein
MAFAGRETGANGCAPAACHGRRGNKERPHEQDDRSLTLIELTDQVTVLKGFAE